MRPISVDAATADGEEMDALRLAAHRAAASHAGSARQRQLRQLARLLEFNGIVLVFFAYWGARLAVVYEPMVLG